MEYHYGWYHHFRHLSFGEINLGKIEEIEDGREEKKERIEKIGGGKESKKKRVVALER
jgi:hypothetical protein